MNTAPETSALVVARELVSAHPQAKLPCPLCAASLRGENLERHLIKVHGEGAGAPALVTSARWSGPARRLPVPVFGALLAAGAWEAAARSGLVSVPPRLDIAIVTACLVTFFAVLALAEMNRLRAHLTFVEETLVLRLPLTLGRRSLTPPAQLGPGTMIERDGKATRVGDDFVWSNEGDRRLGSVMFV